MQLPPIPLVFLGIIILIAIAFYSASSNQPNRPITLFIRDNSYQLEVAKSISQKTKGLSGRTKLCRSCGMIFIYQNEGTYPFWMKDTLIPLDMIWLNKRGEVVSIQTAQPEPGVSIFKLKNYLNSRPAQFILELNAGESDKLGLKEGDIIDLANLVDFLQRG